MDKHDRLLMAAERVLRGLERRIEDAEPSAVPVFDGISELYDAVNEARNDGARSHPS